VALNPWNMVLQYLLRLFADKPEVNIANGSHTSCLTVGVLVHSPIVPHMSTTVLFISALIDRCGSDPNHLHPTVLTVPKEIDHGCKITLGDDLLCQLSNMT
jgi:hypothetical protein